MQDFQINMLFLPSQCWDIVSMLYPLKIHLRSHASLDSDVRWGGGGIDCIFLSECVVIPLGGGGYSLFLVSVICHCHCLPCGFKPRLVQDFQINILFLSQCWEIVSMLYPWKIHLHSHASLGSDVNEYLVG